MQLTVACFQGFGFVTFSTQQEADTAIQSMNETELDGRRIKVKYVDPSSEGPRPCQ